MSKILTLTATGIAGLVLGAGIGVASADTDADGPVDRPPAATAEGRPGSMMDMGAMDMGSMDEMHAHMRDAMPAEMVEQCDEMHAGMAEHMGSGEHDSMMGDAAPAWHAEHHPDQEG